MTDQSESQTLSELGSRFGRTGISTFDRASRIRTAAGVLALLAVLGTGAFVVDRWLLSQLRQAAERELLATHRGQVEALRLWSADRRSMAVAAADTRRVRKAAARIFEAETEEAGLTAATEESETMSEIALNYEFTGWAMIRPDGTGFGGTDRPVVSDLKPEQVRALQAALSGEAALSEPLLVESKEGAAPAFAEGKPAMFVGAPVRTAPGEQRVALLFRIDPDQHFARLLGSSRAGRSEETYAVDRAGVMVSPSRFDDQLRKVGLPNGNSMSLVVADPGADLTRGQRTALPREQWPLTRAAGAVSRGHHGSSLQPYRNYRGVPVVGIWSFLPELQVGLITEIAASDAFVLLNAVRMCFWVLGTLLIGGAIWLFVTSMRARRLAAKAGAAEQLGQYRIVKKIGEGGMGTVYLAEHALIRRPTAIKVFTPDRSAPDLLQRFEREVQVTAKLSHPNTVAVFDYGRQTNGLFYYVMEMIEGIDLDSLIMQNGPMPIARAIHVARQLASSLAEAHSAGIVHRDIKPANVMLTNRAGIADFVKVLDFGLARAPDGHSKLTQAGHLLGTPLYMAPEVLNAGDAASPRSDVYAAGCVLFYLLAGKDAFAANSIPAIITRHATGNSFRLEKEMAGPCPPEVSDLVYRCLDMEPKARFADGAQLAAALEELSYRHPWTTQDARAAWNEQRTHSDSLLPLARTLRIAGGE